MTDVLIYGAIALAVFVIVYWLACIARGAYARSHKQKLLDKQVEYRRALWQEEEDKP